VPNPIIPSTWRHDNCPLPRSHDQAPMLLRLPVATPWARDMTRLGWFRRMRNSRVFLHFQTSVHVWSANVDNCMGEGLELSLPPLCRQSLPVWPNPNCLEPADVAEEPTSQCIRPELLPAQPPETTICSNTSFLSNLNQSWSL
jgi:hypothetical protein